MSKNNFKEYFFPPLVLMIICLVVTATLAFTYNLTEPAIESANTEAQLEAVQSVLPDGDSFKEISGSIYGVTSYFKAENGAGIAVLVTETSYGGQLEVMVGIEENGEITAVEIVSHSDTPGLGDQPMAEDQLAQYIGVSSLDGSGTKESTTIDGVTGATVSSDSIFRAVFTALEQYHAVYGG